MFAETLTLPSFAKINWTLRVLGRRADGFHELHTIFQTVTLHDRLRFTELANERIEIECRAPGIPLDETNLVYRAARALQERYGVRRGVAVELEKKIPAGGGLGGGSSNAAVALLALAHLWRIEAEGSELMRLGSELGADVPFFLAGGTQLGTGVGTELSPLADVSLEHLLIVTPGVKVLTGEAYKALSARALTKDSNDIMLNSSRADAQFPDLLPYHLHNDFEQVVFRLEPEVERVKRALMQAGARAALLSGSGSSVFAIFDNSELQGRAARALGLESGWRVFPCATLGREAYQQALGPCARFLQLGRALS